METTRRCGVNNISQLFHIFVGILYAQVGYDKQGLPIGMQLIGRPWCEASILRLAAAIEETCAGPKKKPVQFYDILKGNQL